MLKKYFISDFQEQYYKSQLEGNEWVHSILDRADCFGDYKIFISMCENSELQAYRDAFPLSGKQDLPLQGVPLAVKDNTHVAGFPLTIGTRAMRGFYPEEDAIVVNQLRKCGAFILGKTNMHELAMGVTSNNDYFGAVHNPHDFNKIPGGSSGGTAAAIAAGIVPVGLATDTVGSGRVPAALCGVVGFRPTVGRYSGDGVVPVSCTMDTVSVMANSVSDVCLLDRVLANAPVHDGFDLSLETLRLGVPQRYFYENLDTGVAECVYRVFDRLQFAGVTLVDIDLGDMSELGESICFPVSGYEIVQLLPDYLIKYNVGLTVDDVIEKIACPGIKDAFNQMWRNRVGQKIYEDVINYKRPELLSRYRESFKQHNLNAIIFPTTPLPAREIASIVEPALIYIQNTMLASVTGAPALSLPAGYTDQKLPVGLEIDGLPDNDEGLLGVGLLLESLLAG